MSYKSVLIGAVVITLCVPALSSGAAAQTAADCAKLSNAKAKDDCVRGLSPKSTTTPAVPAKPAVPGKRDGTTVPATKATPAVPGKGKGSGK